jgi:hypothetical protein
MGHLHSFHQLMGRADLEFGNSSTITSAASVTFANAT